ncbi:DUF1573 domain-containing protein [Cytophagaceae bacterium ABcell3]|nr:DUF1573 domain-containing protein [Cytophagaceae bacterium ABcell3]
MKKVFVVIFCLFAGLNSISAQNNEEKEKQSKEGPEITFIEKSKDFGDIVTGDTVSHVFVFKNTGTEPLIVSDVVTTCGCTAPSWSKQPVMPGQSGDIKVVFNSKNKIGRQNKVVTILSNASNHRETVNIVTNILPKEKEEK